MEVWISTEIANAQKWFAYFKNRNQAQLLFYYFVKNSNIISCIVKHIGHGQTLS